MYIYNKMENLSLDKKKLSFLPLAFLKDFL